MTTSRQLRLAGASVALAAIVVTVASCRAGAGARAGDAGVPPRERGGELTRQLLAGAFDSLPAGIVLDLGGDGDTVLVRWFTDRRRDSLGREWPDDPVLEVEGLSAGADFLARLEARYGREVELVHEAVYRCHFPFCERPRSLEYTRIARFSGDTAKTLRIGWLWTGDSLIGGWIIPSGQALPSELASYEPHTPLRLPFDGEWVVLWGGRELHENYHMGVPPLRFAYDFVVDSAGSLHRTDGRDNADYYCFGRPILSPAAGQVTMALDSFAENVPGTPRPGYRGPGNFVVIDHGNGEFSFLAHLRRGSVRVAAGERLEAGDAVGECGNNGQSVLPHLHYQLQLDARPGSRSVPAPFSDFLANGVRVARGMPTRGQSVMHASRP